MSRAEAPNVLTFKDFIGKQTPEIDISNNKIYKAFDNSIVLIVSSIAYSHIEHDRMDLLRLLDQPNFLTRTKKRVLPKKTKGLPKNITQENGVKNKLYYVSIRQKNYPVAVKKFDPFRENLNGIEQFQALSVLQDKFVHCALPLAATEATLITKWIANPLPNAKQVTTELPPYLKAFKKAIEQLKKEGKWKPSWQVSENPTNYAVRNLNAKDPINRFIAINPMQMIVL